MTPAARYQAAIEVLDRVAQGAVTEQALTNWARAARFAGSKDRAGIRDIVYEVTRRRRSLALRGGGTGGRALILGLLRQDGVDPVTVFAGQGYGPDPLSDAERAAGGVPGPDDLMDLPDWLITRFRASLGSQADAVAQALRDRAPVFVRVNILRTTRDAAQSALAQEGIESAPHALSPTALQLGVNARRVGQSAAYLDGLIELQDVASQAVVDMIPLKAGQKVMDYCAGGGGKTLALAARMAGGLVHAHDANPDRMRDLPQRADRAGAMIKVTDRPRGPYDVVLCDVPCSGSGAWRRAPDGRWTLTPQKMVDLGDVQATILDQAAALVRHGGLLAYATCSVLQDENSDQIAAFLDRADGWEKRAERQFLPSDGGDGFYVACLEKTGVAHNYATLR